MPAFTVYGTMGVGVGLVLGVWICSNAYNAYLETTLWRIIDALAVIDRLTKEAKGGTDS